jgi:hypothetical protein
MITPRHIGHILLAASLASLALPHAVYARGGGHGGTSARMGAAPSHLSPSSAAALSAALAATSVTGPAPPATMLNDALPPSAIAAPAAQMTPVAPPSPVPDSVVLSGGGPVRTDTAPSPTPASTSPTESAASTPGGGGDTMDACMEFWHRGTHMTKAEWRTACARTLNRLDLRSPVP